VHWLQFIFSIIIGDGLKMENDYDETFTEINFVYCLVGAFMFRRFHSGLSHYLSLQALYSPFLLPQKKEV
jgi:hypothetical protein